VIFLSEPGFSELQNYLRGVDQNKNFKELEKMTVFRQPSIFLRAMPTSASKRGEA
jgi:hypothetical protein